MTDVIAQLLSAMNDHDLEGVARLVHQDYRSEQPAHPGRTFTGRAQMRANWEAMFAGIPDFHAELCGSVAAGSTAWSEWHWSGTRTDGQLFQMRGVTMFDIHDGQIVSGKLYLEDVDREVVDIEQAVHTLSGHRPDHPQK